MGRLVQILTAACILSLMGLLSCGSKEAEKPTPSNNSENPSQPVVGLAVGNLAPDFSLPDRDGKSVRLSDFRGKMVLIDFWATWCPPCMAAVPKLERFAEEIGDKVVFLCVSLDTTSKKQWLDMLSNPQFKTFGTFHHVLGDAAVKKVYASNGIPQHCLVDKDGKVLAYPAAGDVKAAEKKIRELLK